MPRRGWALILLALLLAVLAPHVAIPQGGGLDAYGCPHNRKQGGYHCHQGQFAGRSFASQAEILSARQESYTAVSPQLPSIQFSGKVVGVTDGDTITVLRGGRGTR